MIMRIFIFILVGIFLVSCKEEVDSSHDQSVEEHLNAGEWRLVSSEKPFIRFKNGLKFSVDKQVFIIDSQGQIVSPTHERIYTVIGDTLKIIDYRYEQQSLFSRGTDILIIEELTDDKMVLKAIHPLEANELIFENLK